MATEDGEYPPAVAHNLPQCREFVQLEPLEFLIYVRRSRGISDSMANMIGASNSWKRTNSA